MSHRTKFALGLLFCLGATLAMAQTAEELVGKNIQAKGGMDKIKAIKTLRMKGRFQQDSFTAEVVQDMKAPDLMRQEFIIQGMTAVQAYDGSTGWQIQPFGGRKDPELMGEDDLKPFIEDADFYGPLVDYQAKGSSVEYLGHDTIDGDDVYKLKCTLKNGDVYYYYLDPDSYLEIRVETQRYIRGALREAITNYGSYKLVSGVYYPFDIESGGKRDPSLSKISISSIEANIPLDDSLFKMPTKTTPAGQKQPPSKP